MRLKRIAVSGLAALTLAVAACGEDDVNDAAKEVKEEGRQTLQDVEREGRQTARDLDRAVDEKDERKIDKAKRELKQQIDELEQEGSETADDLKRKLRELER